MTIQNVKQFILEKLEEAASAYGILPEAEGLSQSYNPGNLRLRCLFKNFKISPVSDSENILSGEVIAEVLSLPGEMEMADSLTDYVIEIFSSERGELQNEFCKILISSVDLLSLKAEGKYFRSGVSFSVTVWDVYGG